MAYDYNDWLRYAISLQILDQGPKYQEGFFRGIDLPSLIYFVLDNSPNTIEPFTTIEPQPLLGDGDIDLSELNITAKSIDAVGYFILSNSTIGIIENPTKETEELLKNGEDPESIPGLVNKPAIVAFYNGLGGVLIGHSTFTGGYLDNVEWLADNDTYVLGTEVSTPLN